MKKCPKCNAEIQEEARFCLYCMSSFEEKKTIEVPKENNKRWLYIIAAVLVLALIVCLAVLLLSKYNSDNSSKDTHSKFQVSSENSLSFSDTNSTTSKQAVQNNVSHNKKEPAVSSGDTHPQNVSKPILSSSQSQTSSSSAITNNSTSTVSSANIVSSSGANKTTTEQTVSGIDTRLQNVSKPVSSNSQSQTSSSNAITNNSTSTTSSINNVNSSSANNTSDQPAQSNVSQSKKEQTVSNKDSYTQNISKTENGFVSAVVSLDAYTSSASSVNTSTEITGTNDTQSNASSSKDVTPSSLPSTAPPTTTVSYLYRAATYGDDFSVNANIENSVVITGIETVSVNGEYQIPDTLDGKKVVAIMGLAFCDESISNTVKKVIVPSTVKTIWNNAFANCYNLTDIYFKGISIYTESNAFPETSKRNGTLTIHCSANCSDRNYRYYKNSASYYDAEYEEWNG